MNPVSSAEVPKRKNFYQPAATFCLLAPFIGYAISICSLWYLATHLPQSRLGAIIHVVLGAAPLVVGSAGFIFGIIALFGIRRHGVTGILWKVLAGFFVYLVLLIPASQGFHEALVEISWQPPEILAQKIIEADQIVILHEGKNPITMTGKEAKTIINTASLARRDAGSSDAIFMSHIEFYKNTNLLMTIRWQGRLFLCDEGQFSDNTGVLNELYHKSTPN